MKSVGNLLKKVAIASTLTLLPALAQADPGNQYCITPPFITAGLKPNLLLMLDNSASMYDLTYQDTGNKYCANAPTTACTADTTCTALAATCRTSGTTTTTDIHSAKACTVNGNCTANGSTCKNGFCSKCNTNTGEGDCVTTSSSTFTPTPCAVDATCSAITAGDTCNNKCSVTRQCYDTTYDPAATYTGYFNETDTYAYDFTGGIAAGKFAAGATMPGICDYAAGTTRYLCVNTTGTGTAETVVTNATGFVAKGNFLNWLTASKFDIEKEILTGGKYVSQQLIGESRGCAGRKFIKAVPGVSLTFAIRGGTSGGISSTQSQATEYGQTYIDISTGTYNASDCLSAMNDWMTVTSSNPPQLGKFQNDTKGCVGTGGSLGGVTAVSLWNHILHDCYQGLTGGAQGYSANLGPLLDQCQSIYATVAASSMTDPNAGYAVCSSVLTYTDTSGNAQTGYLGACWNGSNFTTNCTEAQRVQRMANYCQVNVSTNPVADPSSTAFTSGGQSAPGFILEQGLLNTQPIGTFPVKIALATAPTGLIDTYKDRIRFGVMTFQNNGSGSECGSNGISCFKTCSATPTRICYFNSDCPSGETCGALSKKDGGEIKTYVGSGYCSVTTTTACDVDSDCTGLTPSGQFCQPSVGDHSTGLTRQIDDTPATSWTPYGEAFYNALGYFARTNAYTESPPTSRSDANFSALAAPNTATNYNANKNPSQYRCQSNNVLLITDGMSTADRNSASENFAALYASQVPAGNTGADAANSCPPYAGSRSIAGLAWVARNRGIKTLAATEPASTNIPASSSDAVNTYVVYSGPQTSSQPGLCNPKTLMEATASNGGTTLFSANDPNSLYTQIDQAFSTVAAKAASGTAASILSNSEGSGANILQAVFYPRKNFDSSTSVNWIGEMQNLWYFVDPAIQNSTIREDTISDKKFNLQQDYVIRFTFDNSQDRAMVQRYSDADGDGVVTSANKVGGLIDPDYVSSIWRAGMKLWKRSDDSTDADAAPRYLARTIYTGYNSSAGSTPQKFSNLAVDGYLNTWPNVWNALQIPAGSDEEREGLATKLIDYIRGTDQPDDTAPCLNADCTYRNRKVRMSYCSNNDQIRCSTAADCPSGAGVTCIPLNSEWKLGDIVSSTPRVQSSVRLNSFNFPAPGGYSDGSYQVFIDSTAYQNRGMVYVGANDGMLHAFKLGTLLVKGSGFEKASLIGSPAELGMEKWAFIPKHSFPYLKYAADKNYSHLYYVDGRTTLLDAAIGDTNSGTCVAATYWNCPKPRNTSEFDASTNTWRTVVIGSMGLGGASRNNTETCTEGAAGDCVKTPVNGLGYSSYFALDVTNPDSPKFLWEFSNNRLGYATTAPAIVRIGDRDKNGRWFAVFGNGPFGPIDTGSHQFKGESDRRLRLFIVDLRSGALVRTIVMNGTDGPLIDDAFVGTMMGGAIDADRRDPSSAGNYQDDAVYAGFVKRGDDGEWTQGGVIRLMTKEDINPANWTVSKVIDDIGPVTTSIARLQDTRPLVQKLWLFFGTGRYYYRDATSLDDNDTRRSLFGIQEPCYNTADRPGNVLDGDCTAAVDPASLVNQTSSISALSGTDKGWRIDMDVATASAGAERVVTDTVALTNGAVFFTSFKPTLDICGYGGNSYLWGVDYDSGGQVPPAALKGKALIQLSTGEFREVDLSSIFTDKLNRRGGDEDVDGDGNPDVMTGKPPSDAPPIVSNSQNRPVKKILHIREH